MNEMMFEKIAETAYIDEMEKMAKGDLEMTPEAVAQRRLDSEGVFTAKGFGGTVIGRMAANKIWGGKVDKIEKRFLRTPRRRMIGKTIGMITGATIGRRISSEDVYLGHMRDNGIEGKRSDARYYLDRDKRYYKNNKKAVKSAVKKIKKSAKSFG